MNYEQTKAVIEKREWAKTLMECLCEQEDGGAHDTFESLSAYLKEHGYDLSTRQISNVLKKIAGFDRERHQQQIASAETALQSVEDLFDEALERRPAGTAPDEWERTVYHIFTPKLEQAQERLEEAENRLQRERKRVSRSRARTEAVRAYRRMKSMEEQGRERFDLVSGFNGHSGGFFISPIHLAAIDIREIADALGISFDQHIEKLGLDPITLR